MLQRSNSVLLKTVLVLSILAPSANALASPTSPGSQNQELLSHFKNQMILAPLTRGGNLPFRRLCADFGMKVSLSEMVYARFLLKGERIEHARMRRAPNEEYFGVQIATNDVEEGQKAMRLAAQAGADFVDLNCGCPIHEATRRNLGSALLRSPVKLANLVQGMLEGNQKEEDESYRIPLSVKVRLGIDSDNINVSKVVDRLRNAGASAVTIHGRTAIQGYRKPADWNIIRSIVHDNDEISNIEQNADKKMAIVGNGDIFTFYEARRRVEESGVDAVMVGRGALIKPWIFQEFQQQQSWEPDLSDRVSIYRRLACYMKEYFGDDEMGRRKSWNFLPWHFDFFARYIELPEEKYGTYMEGPLIQMRGPIDRMAPLDLLLSHRSTIAHDKIAAILWDSDSDKDAFSRLALFAESAEFDEILKLGDVETTETKELSNIRQESGKWHQRRPRNPKPQRTDEEIAEIRAQRAAKKASLAMQNSSALD